MYKGTLTQREFASHAGISTATVSKMLKAGELQTASNGKILASEVNRYFENEVAKYAAKSFLIVTFNASTDYYNAQRDTATFVLKDKCGLELHYFESIEDIIEKARNSDEVVNVGIRQQKYNKYVIDSMISQYKNRLEDYYVSLIRKEHTVFKRVPAEIAMSLLLYNKVINVSCSDDEVNYWLNIAKDSMRHINLDVDRIYDELMTELCLTKPDGELLFMRSDLSPEFMSKEGELYSFLTEKQNGEVLNLQHNVKIWNSMRNKTTAKTIKQNINNLLSKGYFSIYDFKSTEDIKGLCYLLVNKLYKYIIITANRTAFERDYPDILKSIDFAGQNNFSEVIFADSNWEV